jgi:hypothetical protein
MKEMVGEHGLTFRRFDWRVPGTGAQDWIVIHNPENAENIPNADAKAKILNVKDRFHKRIVSKLLKTFFLKSK